MMPLFAALEVVIAVVVVAVPSPSIELCALRDGNEAGSSEADVTASMGEGDASVAESK